MLQATPQLQSAWQAVMPILGGDFRTSVIGLGKHAPHSAHYEGKAVDVAPPWTGDNQQSWNFIGNCVNTKRFNKIGIYPPLFEKAEANGMVAWAKSRGVEIFSDPGSGPHFHLQVP